MSEDLSKIFVPFSSEERFKRFLNQVIETLVKISNKGTEINVYTISVAIRVYSRYFPDFYFFRKSKDKRD
jgi:hypothetical protein